jgi:hypothetical protein
MLDKIMGLVKPLVKKVMSVWNKIPEDKQAHVIAGFKISLFSGLVLLCWGMPMWWHCVVTACVAVGKEVFDHFHPEKHTCDPKDAVATMLGCIPAHVVLCVVRWLI